MTSTDVYNPTHSSNPSSSTMSFGAHRHMDVPASAIRAGASSMPRAWQTRGIHSPKNGFQHGAPVRSIADIVTSPFRRAISTTPRKIAVAGTVVVAAILLIF